MTDENAGFTIDLSGGGDETPGAKIGRIVGGLLLLILGVVIMVASLAAFVLGAFNPAIADWYDWISDGILFVGIIGFGLAAAGFEVIRRSRKARRAAEAAEAAAVIQATKPSISGPTIT